MASTGRIFSVHNIKIRSPAALSGIINKDIKARTKSEGMSLQHTRK